MSDSAPPSSSPRSARDSARLVEAGLTAWPSLVVNRDALARHVQLLPAPKVAYAADVVLSFACASRDPEALRALDALVRGVVAGAVAKIDSSPSFADDVGQSLREHLLLTTPPTIAAYAGRASLRTWLATASVRMALNMRRRKEDDAGARVAITSSYAADPTDVDLGHLRARYRDRFAAALRDALGRLPERERSVLHLAVGQRATLEKIGEAHGVGISTAARWITAARERLALDVRTTLREGLGITASEYEGLVPHILSDIDVSLAGLLEGRGQR